MHDNVLTCTTSDHANMFYSFHHRVRFLIRPHCERSCRKLDTVIQRVNVIVCCVYSYSHYFYYVHAQQFLSRCPRRVIDLSNEIFRIGGAELV